MTLTQSKVKLKVTGLPKFRKLPKIALFYVYLLRHFGVQLKSLGLPREFFATRVLVNFYYRLQFSISGCSLLQSIHELLEFMQTWGFAISFATCQSGNRSEYCPFGAPGTLIHQSTIPFFVTGSLY